MKINKKFRLSLLLLLFFSLFGSWAFFSGLTVREYTINTPKIPRGKSVCIVHLSDLHSEIFGENQKDLLAAIQKEKPDFIVMTGDIADDMTPIEGTEQLLFGASSIAPMFYVPGNHEFWSGHIGEIRMLFTSHRAIVLENAYREVVTTEGVPLVIGGMDDPETSRYEKLGLDWPQTLQEISAPLAESERFVILLSHRPELVETYQTIPVDLVLSGHAHGGQIRIPPFLNGIYAPQQGFFPSWAGGLYRFDTFIQIVSRGLADTSPLPRFFNPPEVVVIHLVGEG